MKILNINYTDITQLGGINSSIRRTSEELVKRGHECYVLSINPGNLKSEEIINGVKVIRIKSPESKYLYGFSFSIINFLLKNLGKSLNPDIIHIHEYRNLLTLEVAQILSRKKIPFVFSPHYDQLGYNTFAGKYLMGLYKPIGSKIFRKAGKIITNSQWSAMILSDEFPALTEKIVVIPHGVDKIRSNSYKPKKTKEDTLKLLYVGALIELKGIHHIIQTIKELVNQNIKVTLTIVGKGNYEKNLRILSEKLKMEENIYWCQPLFGEKLYEKYLSSDIFLLLSKSESYGLVVSEALSAGLPCIVSKTTALTEFLDEPGCYGIDYPPDSKKLSELILRIHLSEIKIGPFSNKIRTWERVAEDYERLYESIRK